MKNHLNKNRINSILSDFIFDSKSIIPGHDSKKKKNRKEHNKDEAIEEYVDKDSSGNSHDDKKKDHEKKKGGMGHSKRAEEQHTDEGDTIKDKK